MIAVRARDWALALTGRASVTGTAGEASFGPWLAQRLASAPVLAARARVWTMPVGAEDGRHCVAMLVRGDGRPTVVLTGHYDTVSVEDYGDLAAVATDPLALRGALERRLAVAATTPAELRARADLASGDFLPGRGLLDMKAGLAAGIAVAERFAAEGGMGNILFLAVPDEEASSAGARHAARELPAIAAAHDLELVAAINLDAMADDGDGAAGRIVALGTIGKLLPTAFVVGVATHAGFPHAGLNAAVLAAAIAARVEWARELTDATFGPATPPSLLCLRDGKPGYDITTPASAFAAFNVQFVSRTPAEVLEAFDGLCRDAVAAVLADLRRRAAEFPGRPHALYAIEEVPVLRFEALAAMASDSDLTAYDAALSDYSAGDLPLPEQCRLVTERLWAASGLAGPAIVTGFGSMPYLPTRLSDAPAARALAEAAARAALTVGRRHRMPIRCEDVFAGVSDMSFFGEADEASLAAVARNTPVWGRAIAWPAEGGIADLPTVNAGPWGRDYHTPLERLHQPYAFAVLPDLLTAIVEEVLGRPITGETPPPP